MAYPVPDPYTEAIRGSVAVTYTVDPSYQGSAVAGATGLRPTGGTITDTTKPGVRRLLNLQLAGGHELFDLLAPIGTTLTVTAHVQYTDRSTVDVPMGVFDVDSQSISEGGGAVSLTAPDKWVRIQRARFIRPQASIRGSAVVHQIVALIRDALGAAEPVNITATSSAIVGALVWEKDRDAAIIELAESIGAWVYFDRNGVATIADIPTGAGAANWQVDAGADGVLVELDRERSRANTRNVVVVESSAAEGEAFPAQVVWDYTPSSPTYAGPNPVEHPEQAGPFGVVPFFWDTPLPLSRWGAVHAGRTILARVTGLASQVSLGQVPNPALDAFDTLDVLPPGSRTVQVGFREVTEAVDGEPAPLGTAPLGTAPLGGGTTMTRRVPIFGPLPTRVRERHIADTVTHPLTVGAVQQIEGRSTGAETVEGGS